MTPEEHRQMPMSYDECLALIAAAPDEGVWATVKKHAALVRETMKIHEPRLGKCWTRRKRNEIIQLYNTVRFKQEMKNGIR